MEILEYSEILQHGLRIIEDDVKIIDYLIDRHGDAIVKDFDHRPENTGVALFFDNRDKCRNLVLVLRMKYFKEEKDNGLIMLVVEDIFQNSRRKDALIKMLQKSFDDNSVLRNEVIISVEIHTMKSIEMNA